MADDIEPRSRLKCFAIGPIGNRHAPHGSSERQTYEEALAVMEEVIEPACEQAELGKPVRADTLARAGEITEQIFRRLRDDDVVIADLTGANANVMYELGLRHTRDKLTVQLGEYGRLPFDINIIRTIQFSRSPNGLINARNELRDVLSAGAVGEYDPVSATRIWCETDAELPSNESSPSAVETNDETTPAPDSEERGFLDVMAEAETLQEDLIPSLQAVNEHIVALGDLSNSSAEEVAASDAAGRGMRGRLQVAAKYASGLERITSELEADIVRYAVALGAVSEGNLALIALFEEDPSRLEESDVQQFGMTLRGAARVTREAMSALGGMADAVDENARLSRVLRRPSSRLSSAISRFSEATSTVDEWDRRLESLGVPMPDEGWEPDLKCEDTNGSEDPRDEQPGERPDSRDP